MQPHLYQLGPNLLPNGDSTDTEHVTWLHSVTEEIGLSKAEICLTDPPYGVSLHDRHVKKPGKRIDDAPFRTAPLLNDDLSGESFLSFLCPIVSSRPITWYHPTSKPVQLLRDMLDSTTIVGDTVIDPFAGTGSSLVACHRTGRKWLGIELEPRYCLATCLRFRYETANQVPVYEILPNGDRLELGDAELKARFDLACQEQAKAKQTVAKGGSHA